MIVFLIVFYLFLYLDVKYVLSFLFMYDSIYLIFLVFSCEKLIYIYFYWDYKNGLS